MDSESTLFICQYLQYLFLAFSINYAAALIANSDMEGAVSAYLTALQYNPVYLIDHLEIVVFNHYFLGFIWRS